MRLLSVAHKPNTRYFNQQLQDDIWAAQQIAEMLQELGQKFSRFLLSREPWIKEPSYR